MNMDQIQQHLQAGELAEAETGLRAALLENPENAEACFLLAQLCQQRGELDEPLALLERAEQLEPFNPNIFHARGVLLINRQEFEPAERAFRAGLDINPSHAASLNGLAFLELNAGRFEAAIHAAEQVLAETPDDARALSYKGTAELELGHTDAAILLLQEALRHEPGSLTAQAQLGRAFLSAGNHAFAVQCFENVLQQSPGSADLQEYLGRARLALGETEQALEPLRAAVEQGRANPDLFRATAMAELAAGRPAEAEALLAAAHQLAPEREDVVLPLAGLLVSRGANGGAVELLQAFRERGADSVALATALSRAQLFAGDAEAAVATLTPHAQAEAAAEDTRLAYAQALDAADQSEQAEAVLAGLLDAEEPALDTLTFHAMRLADARDEAAIDVLQEVVNRPGLNQRQLLNYRALLADCLHRAGRYEEAAGQYGAMAHRRAAIVALLEHDDDEFKARAVSAMDPAVTADWPKAMPAEAAQPIFAVGWPGSGQERILPALAAHSGVSLLMDEEDAQAGRRQLLARDTGAGDLSILSDTQLELRRGRYMKALGDLAHEMQILDVLWLSAELLPGLARIFPGARVLLMERDPRDMTVAWMQGGYRDLEPMARAYKRQLQLLQRCRESLPLHFIPVSYEAVCEQPQQELDRLQQELGLTTEPVVTARFLEISMPSIAEPGDHEHYAPIAAEAQPGPGSEALH